MATQRDYRSEYLREREQRLAYVRSSIARQKRAEYSIKWKKEHPEESKEHQRASQTKGRYGLTREEHRALYDVQNHSCAICGVHQSKLKKRFCIDHDHNTGLVRGLLCNPCNSVLGHARDDIGVLGAAINYLAKFNG